MMIKLKYRISITFLFVAIYVMAQRSYTLNECISLAQQNNVTLRNARLEQTIAKETSLEALTHYFPTIYAGGMITRASDDLVKIGLDLSALGVPYPIEKGMINKGKIAMITAVQPIFVGGRIINSNKLAHIGEKVSNLKTTLSQNEVELSTEKCFWQIVSLKEKMHTLDVLSSQLEELHRSVKNMVEVGVAMPNDLLKVELHQQSLESSRLKVENGLCVSKLLLRQKMGITEKSFDIASDSFPEIKTPMDYYVEASEGVSRRAETQLLEANVQASKLQHRLALGKNLPSIGVGASYFWHDLMGKDENAGVIFASVLIPISDWWGGAYTLRREKLKIEQAQNSQEDSKELMMVDIESKWSNLQEAYSQIFLAKKSIVSSEENLRLNQNCFDAGTIPLTELLDAETMLQKSRDQYTDACVAYFSTLREYRQAVGE